MRRTLDELIRSSCSHEEYQRNSAFAPTDADMQTVLSVGHDVLKQTRFVPGACAPMSAIWTITLRRNYRLPAYMVAGALLCEGDYVFGHDAEEVEVAASFSGTNLDWDGHCWMAIGTWIADISLLRTARSDKCPPRLKELA